MIPETFEIKLQQHLSGSGLTYSKQLSMRQLTSAEWRWISGLVSMQRDAILNIWCSNGCRMFSVNIFVLNWLNSVTTVSCDSNAGIWFLDTVHKITAVELT